MKIEEHLGDFSACIDFIQKNFRALNKGYYGQEIEEHLVLLGWINVGNFLYQSDYVDIINSDFVACEG